MAKKSAASSYNSTLIQIQKLANNSAQAIQKMINKSNTQQATFNSAEAQKSRDWQEKMSKTAHQMEVEDLKKAGLNPVLSTGGAGAQSYTTSSASTQNDSGASSTAAILSGELGAMSNMESARMSADAQMKAATLSAKATRYAAQQSAAAQMYNTDVAYKLGKYKADLGYKSQQEDRANARWIATHSTANSWAGLIDKTLEQYGIRGGAKKVIKNAFSLITGKGAKSMFTNPNPTKNNFKLRAGDSKNIQNDLKGLGIKPTKQNVNYYVQARVFADKKALKKLIVQTPDYAYSRPSSGGYW